MEVFSDKRGAGSSARSAEELRLSDLENWLKEFESREGKAANKRQ